MDIWNSIFTEKGKVFWSL